jgi:hypothetical protein
MIAEPAICVVTGGRDYPWGVDDAYLLELIWRFHAPVGELWHGGAVGVDQGAARLAAELGIPVRVFLPEPELFADHHEIANVKRNARMMVDLEAAIRHEHRRGFAVAFPGHDGTDNAVGHALRRGIHVVDLRSRPYSPRTPR